MNNLYRNQFYKSLDEMWVFSTFLITLVKRWFSQGPWSNLNYEQVNWMKYCVFLYFQCRLLGPTLSWLPKVFTAKSIGLRQSFVHTSIELRCGAALRSDCGVAIIH